jgi:hypothetical protein
MPSVASIGVGKSSRAPLLLSLPYFPVLLNFL